jgi:hypothetical protein
MEERIAPPSPRQAFPWRGWLLGTLLCISLSITEPYVKLLLYYYHAIPVPNLTDQFMILRNTTRITVRLNFAILGLSYLLALDVGLSIWFFHLLIKIESGIFTMVGLVLKGRQEPWGGSSFHRFGREGSWADSPIRGREGRKG